MSNLNAGIILASQHPNTIRSYGEGLAQGNALTEIQQRAQMRNMLREQGPDIMNGDPSALAALAQMSPEVALGIQAQRQDLQAGQLNMDATRQRMRVLNAQEQRAVAEAARQMSTEERAQQAAEIERGVRMGLAAQTPQQWDSMMQQLGRTDLVGRFDQRNMIAAQFMDIADVLKMNEGPKPLSTPGKVQADINAGLLPQGTALRQEPMAIYTGDNPPPPGQTGAGTATPRNAGVLGKKLSESDAAALDEMTTAARGAADLESLGNQLSIVSEGVGYTGPGGGAYALADDVLGVLPGSEGARGAFRSLAMEAQLSFTEKTKGAITDREMGMFREAVPNLGQRKDANKAIAAVMQAGARRVQTRAAFFENWARKNGSLEGAHEVWAEYMRDNPVLEGDGKGGIAVRKEGGWEGYLNRKPAMSYTPEVIMGLTEEGLSQIPIERMTAQQIDAIEMRYNQLRNGQ